MAVTSKTARHKRQPSISLTFFRAQDQSSFRGTTVAVLYHLNHGFRACQPGGMFDLLPVPVVAGSDFAAEFDQWRQDFPEGVSLFGLRHIVSDPRFGEVPKTKLEMEYECESVRRRFFGHIRSRFQSFFAVATLEEALSFRNTTKASTGITGAIWEIEADRIHHKGDMRLLASEDFNEGKLCAYWEGRSLDHDPAVWELLATPPVTMVRCVVPDD